MSKNPCSTYGQKLLNATKSATDEPNATSKRMLKTGDLVRNKIVGKIMSVALQKTSDNSTASTMATETDEVPMEKPKQK